MGYGRGKGVVVEWGKGMEEMKRGRGRKVKEGRDVGVVRMGGMGKDGGEGMSEVEGERGMRMGE